MRVIKNDQVVGYDVDLTLVLWNHPESSHEINGVPFKPHEEHIASIKQASAAGEHVVIWSKRGWKWARKVVKLLGLAPYVNTVQCKPSRYYDDKDANEWMYRVFKGEEEYEEVIPRHITRINTGSYVVREWKPGPV